MVSASAGRLTGVRIVAKRGRRSSVRAAEQHILNVQIVGALLLPAPVGERTWQQWEGPEGGNAETGVLLGPEDTGGTTVVVHGTAEASELDAFLASVTARV